MEPRDSPQLADDLPAEGISLGSGVVPGQIKYGLREIGVLIRIGLLEDRSRPSEEP